MTAVIVCGIQAARGELALEWVIFWAAAGAFAVNGAKSIFTAAFPDLWLYFLGATFVIIPVLLPKGFAVYVSRLLGKTKQPGGPGPKSPPPAPAVPTTDEATTAGDLTPPEPAPDTDVASDGDAELQPAGATS